MVRTAVGDKNVIDEMLRNGYNFGGEQSGHLIFRDYSTTGMAWCAALQILRIMKITRQAAVQTGALLDAFPATVTNVKVRDKKPFAELEGLNGLVAAAERDLAAQGGRLLLRYFRHGTQSAPAGGGAEREKSRPMVQENLRRHSA